MMKRKYLFFIFVLILLVQTISAQYISGDIYIRENGDVSFFVETDIDLNLNGLNYNNYKIRGITPSLTSKQGEIWIFTFDLETYDNILLDIHLPSNVYSIKSINSDITNIFDVNKKTISLIDSNKELDISIEYALKSKYDISFIYFLIILSLIIIVIYLLFKKMKTKKRKLEHVFPLINDNERKIIELLMKKSMRQKEIRKKLNIPKASFSRYLFNLEKKKLIVREGAGRNRIVELK